MIREARAADAAAVLDLTVQGIRTWGEGFVDRLASWMEQVCNLAYIEHRLVDPAYKNFVAEKDGHVVGSIYLNLDDANNAYMGGLYCSLKRHGVGSALLRRAIVESQALGYSRMECEIYAGNEASISLMSKYGAVYAHTDPYDGVEYHTYIIPL